MNIQPGREGKSDVSPIVMGLALALAIATVPMAIFAVLSRDCAQFGAAFGLVVGGTPALLAFFVAWRGVAVDRRNGGSDNGLAFTRKCWGTAAVSLLIVVCASVLAHPVSAGQCTP